MPQIYRVTDATELKQVMANTPALREVNVDMDDWIADPNNVAYTDGQGNFGAFEFEFLGVYSGHYFFSNARGRQAIELGKAMLVRLFDEEEAQVIRGLTPTDHKGALWMNRRLGFKPYNVIETEVGPHQLFVLSRRDHEKDKHQ